MRVLIVSQHFWPESFRINDVARSLAQAGLDVRVLTGKPNYPEGRLFPGYGAAGTATEDYGEVRVHRVPLAPRGRGGAARLAGNYLSFIAAASTLGPGLLGAWRPDVVFTYATSPVLQAIAAHRIAARAGAARVVWVQDLWPESLSATGFVTNRAALRAVEEAVRWIYRQADLLLVQSDALVAPVRRLAGGTPIAVHPNPGETNTGHGAAAPRLAGSFPIVFAGNLGTVQDLPTVLAAAGLTRSEAALRWVLVGSGALSGWLADEVRARGLGNVDLLGRVPPETMPGILAQAGAALVTLAAGPLAEAVVPSKLQAYLAAGRPILAGLGGEGARVVRAAGAGLVAAPGDAAALAAAALALYRLPAPERDALGRAGRDYYARHYAPEVLTPALVAHLRDALARRFRP